MILLMKTKNALLILLAGLSVFASRADVVITSTFSNFGYNVDTSQDLVLNVPPTSNGHTENMVLYTLTDGQTPIQPAQNNLVQGGCILTFDMGAAATINEIKSYSTWGDNGRVIQDYTVDTSADGINWTLAVITVVNQGAGASGAWPTVEVTVSTSDSSPLATGVRYIRFNFPNPQNGAVGYQEFVVNGVSSGLPQAPVFTTIPQSQTVTNGDSVTFTAQVTGFPPPLITWHFVDSGNVDHLLSNIGNTLTIAHANILTDAGSYYATASNSSGSVNSTPVAVLTIMPGMVTETDDNSGNAFTPPGANDLIWGNPGTSVALNSWDVSNGWTPLNLTDGDSQGPNAIGIPNEVLALIGDNGTITYDLGGACTITGIQSWTGWGGRGNQNYTVSYSQDGTTFKTLWTVANNPNQNHGNMVSLAINNLANVVKIKFDFGAQQNGGVLYTELAVYGTSPFSPAAPVFTVMPQSQTVTNGDPVTFTTQTTGYPRPIVRWHFIDGGAVDHLLPSIGDTRTIAHANILTDAGSYYAIASNSSGSVTSTPLAVLTIMPSMVTETDDNSGNAFTPPGANDLILNNPGTNVALNNFDTQNGWTPANLTDGDPQGPNTVGNGNGVYSLIGNNGTITYDLGVSCTITGIQSWTGFAGGGRDNQNYTVSYSQDGTTFKTLWTVANNPNVNHGNMVSLAVTNLANVVRVKFDFGAQENGGVAYTELAVYGQASTVPRALSAARDFWGSTQVSVLFTQPLDPATATNKLNYSINNGATVSAATMSTGAYGLTTVVLTTSPLSLGTAYVVTINHVQAADGGTIAPNTQLPVSMPVGLISDAVRTTTASGTNIMVVLEAENYNAATTNSAGFYWVLTTTPNNLLAGANSTNYSGTGVMEAQPYGGANVVNYGNNTTGPELSYKVYFTAAGTYYPWVRGVGDAPPGANNQRSIVLGLDNQVITASSGFVSTNGYSWLPGGFSSPNLPYTVTAGPHTVNVWMRQSGFDFDKLVLTTDPNYLPSASNTVPNNNIGPEASPGPGITVTPSGANQVLTWVGGGILQSSTNVGGTYTDIIGSSSPWQITPTGLQKYYRVRQ